MSMTALTVYLGAEDGHDLHQVLTEPLLRVHGLLLMQDQDRRAQGAADAEDDLGAEAQQAVLVGQDQCLDAASKEEREQLHEPLLLVVEARTQVGNDAVAGLAGLSVPVRDLGPLALKVLLLVMRGDADVTYDLALDRRPWAIPAMAAAGAAVWEQLALPFPTPERLGMNAEGSRHGGDRQQVR